VPRNPILTLCASEFPSSRTLANCSAESIDIKRDLNEAKREETQMTEIVISRFNKVALTEQWGNQSQLLSRYQQRLLRESLKKNEMKSAMESREEKMPMLHEMCKHPHKIFSTH
jgi:hypothetical protein